MIKHNQPFSWRIPSERETQRQKSLERRLPEIGPSEAVARWLSKCGSIQTRLAYASELCYFLRWLKDKGINMNPDELVKDNLGCVFESSAVDVATKRRHTDFLNEYINTYLLVQREDSESKRVQAAAAIKMFYRRNDRIKELHRQKLTSRAIARELGISQSGVAYHLAKQEEEYNLANRGERMNDVL